VVVRLAFGCNNKSWISQTIIETDERAQLSANIFFFTLFLCVSACALTVLLLFKLGCLARSHTLDKAKKKYISNRREQTDGQQLNAKYGLLVNFF
jgi:hypothetical protein